MRLSLPGVVIVAVYIAAIVSIGVALKPRAARGMESCFPGSRRLPTGTVPPGHLAGFYKRSGVWGCWGPVARRVAETDPGFRRESSAGRDPGNVSPGVVLQAGLYLGPMYPTVHGYSRATACLALACARGAALYFAWYRHLPRAD